MKEQVDADNQSGFPYVNFGVLLFIALVLYLIWDKLNEKIDPSKRGGPTVGGMGWSSPNKKPY